MEDLREINVVSGVNESGSPFVTVSAVGSKKTMLLGQLDPTTIRQMAMQFIECAEAAEQDAAVLRVLRKLELPDELAALIVRDLRNSREPD